MKQENFLLKLYKDRRSVFRLPDIAMLFPGLALKNISERMRYYIKTNDILKLRKGVFAKPDYNPFELANRLYTPSYISLETVLQEAGIIFQYDSSITCVSYLSREVVVDKNRFRYRKIKEDILLNPQGIFQAAGTYSKALPERAFLDMLYLEKIFYFDNLNNINRQVIDKIIPIYHSHALENRVSAILK